MLLSISSLNLYSQSEKSSLTAENTYYSLWDPGWSCSQVISQFDGVSGFSNTLLSYNEKENYIRFFKLKGNSEISPQKKGKSKRSWSLIQNLNIYENGKSMVFLYSKELNIEHCLTVKEGKTLSFVSQTNPKNEEWALAYPLQSKKNKTLLLYNKKTGTCSYRNLDENRGELLSPLGESLLIEKGILDFCEIVQNNTRYLAALLPTENGSQILLYTIQSKGESQEMLGKKAGRINVEGRFTALEYVSYSTDYLILYSAEEGLLKPLILDQDFSVPTIKEHLNEIQVIPKADSYTIFFSQKKEDLSRQIINAFLQSSVSGETAIYQLRR